MHDAEHPIPASQPESPIPALAERERSRIAELALACAQRPYPYHLSLVLREPADLDLPSRLTPAFYGCFDWHSAVHAHWSLARIARRWPDSAEAPACWALLDRHLSSDRLAAELAFLEPREGFERPYGLAWLLALAAELHLWKKVDPDVRRWASSLEGLESLAARRLLDWYDRLPAPIRSGEHSQSAFAMGMVRDWAVVTGGSDATGRIDAASLRLHGADRDAPLHLEPSGHDFLSPALGVADLMRRCLAPADFAGWLDRWLPGIPEDSDDPVHPESIEAAGSWLPVPRSPDPEDGKLAHLDGLASSRAWMLAGMAAGLPASDRRREALLRAAKAHALAGRAALATGHYASTHWLGTFALYAADGGPTRSSS